MVSCADSIVLHYIDNFYDESVQTLLILSMILGSRGPAVLDDFTASYGFKFSDATGAPWPTMSAAP